MEYQATNRNFNTHKNSRVHNTHGNCVTQAIAAAVGIPYKAAAGITMKHGGAAPRIEGDVTTINGVHTYRIARKIIKSLKRPVKVHVFATTRIGRYFQDYFEGRNLYFKDEALTLEPLVQELVVHEKGTTTKNFPNKFKEGRFLVIRDCHAVASVYGQIFDNNHAELVTKNKAVQFAIEFLPVNK